MAHAGTAWQKAGSVCSFLRDDDGAMKNFAFGFVIRVSARRAVPFPRSLARHRSIAGSPNAATQQRQTAFNWYKETTRPTLLPCRPPFTPLDIPAVLPKPRQLNSVDECGQGEPLPFVCTARAATSAHSMSHFAKFVSVVPPSFVTMIGLSALQRSVTRRKEGRE